MPPFPNTAPSIPEYRARQISPSVSSFPLPIPSFPPLPRHSRASGNPEGSRAPGARASRPHPRPSMDCVSRQLARIRICGIMGFSGFYRRVFDPQAPVHIHFGEIPVMAKSAIGRNRNPENPSNPENPDSDKDARMAFPKWTKRWSMSHTLSAPNGRFRSVSKPKNRAL